MRNHRFAFPLFFVFWLAVLGTGVQTEWFHAHVRMRLQEWLAASCSVVFSLVGIESHSNKTVVFAGNFGAHIIPDCDGIVLVVLFLSAVLAFPAPRRLALIPATLAGLAIVVALNWVRVFALVLTGYFNPEIVEFSHVYVWQGVLILGTVLVWLGWANYALRLEGRGPPTPEPSD